MCMGSSDWLRVYPFEEHLLHLHGAGCQQAQSAVQLALLPTPTQWHPFSDERGEGEFTGQLCVTLNGGTRQALDRGLEDNTGQHSIRAMTAQARKGACVEPATARENVVVCRCSLSMSLRIDSKSFAQLEPVVSSPRAGQAAGLISVKLAH